VTDQGSRTIAVSVTIPPPREKTASEEEPDIANAVCHYVYCRVCGRTGHYIETFYESG
jgi:hypothetical protein